MTNEIDKKIQSAIEQQAGYSLSVFKTRFNDGTMDAVMVFQDVHGVYGRYMTRDYCTTMLGLNKWKVQQFFQGKLVWAKWVRPDFETGKYLGQDIWNFEKQTA